MITVLAADDEPTVLRTVTMALAAHGYRVRTAVAGRQALEVSASLAPDVVVLDLGLPDMDGLEVIRALRAASQVPIIVISGRRLTTEKVQALDAGADDYVTKPFGIDVLLARVAAAAPAAATGPQVVIGNHIVDLAWHSVSATSEPGPQHHVQLTGTEWSLLELLLTHPGQLVRQGRLLEAISGSTAWADSAVLRHYMAQIRRKLEPDPTRPRFLLTELGMGYRFQPSP
jgi:two-component system, OmpR family, KDP operon response regulator KdpE